MINAIFWNIRGMRSQKADHRLKNLVKKNKVQFAAIFEPFVHKQKIEVYKRFLEFKHCMSNDIGQMWCFLSEYVNATVISMDDQQMTLQFESNNDDAGIFITAVYAKYTAGERKDLWESLVNIESQVDGAWCIGGDFNVILEPCEKLGGRPHRASKIYDFAGCLDLCGDSDVGYIG
ncbi:uncharacterized protein LOC142163222 [Nicotiana tabacum]|uniref:Uncharacterized protein LOC142163222 n=1 Tax=Nicotiana tabacum TaxID=4097 RepID=A0AC58RV74_TOBAC